MDSSDCGHATIIVIAQVRYQELHWSFHIHRWAGYGIKNRLEKRLQGRFQFHGCSSLLGDGIGVDDRKIGLLVSGTQFDK